MLHIVRHPGGFLNSWRNRYLARRDPEAVSNANRARLKIVTEADPSSAALFGDIDQMCVEESELWYWRYATETIHAAGAALPAYKLIIYEKLAADPVGVARRVYEICGLPWHAAIQETIRKSSSDSTRIADAWRSNMRGESCELLDRIMEQSRMRQWWD